MFNIGVVASTLALGFRTLLPIFWTAVPICCLFLSIGVYFCDSVDVLFEPLTTFFLGSFVVFIRNCGAIFRNKLDK